MKIDKIIHRPFFDKHFEKKNRTLYIIASGWCVLLAHIRLFNYHIQQSLVQEIWVEFF